MILELVDLGVEGVDEIEVLLRDVVDELVERAGPARSARRGARRRQVEVGDVTRGAVFRTVSEDAPA